MEDPLISCGMRRAAQAGSLPGQGAPVVAGVQLPAGRPAPEGRPAYWVTDETAPNIGGLAASLADVFPETGLWPLLWQWNGEGPAEYLRGPYLLGETDFTDLAGEVIWSAWPDTTKPSPWGQWTRPWTDERLPMAEAGRLRPSRDDLFRALVEPPLEDWRLNLLLMLVPCRRPADALAATGWDASEIPPPLIAAVLRSWEDRFAAHLVSIDPSTISIHVAAPPSDARQALALAYELLVMIEPGGSPDLPEDLAPLLIARDDPGTRFHTGFSSELWQFAFVEECQPALDALAASRGWRWPEPT